MQGDDELSYLRTNYTLEQSKAARAMAVIADRDHDIAVLRTELVETRAVRDGALKLIEWQGGMIAKFERDKPMKMDEWLDISVETEREYLYSDGSSVVIDDPLFLRISVSSQGGHAHRVVAKDNVGYYIAPGWVACRWKVAPGSQVFKF